MYVVVSELANTVNGKAVKAGVLGAVLAVTAFAGPVQATLNQAGTGTDTSISFGDGAKAERVNSIALGNGALAGVTTDPKTGSITVAVGYQAKAEGNSSVAIGGKAYASEINAVAIGIEAKSKHQNTVAIGSVSNASGQSAVAIGQNANASSNRATAIGANSSAAWYATAIGSRAVAAANSVAIGGGGTDGSYAQTDLKQSVAVGTFARTKKGINTAEATVTAKDTTLKLTNFAGKLTNETKDTSYVVSFGDAGKERQVQNVAAGQITATSTDAINGSQLYSLTTTVGTMADTVKAILGGDADVAETGAITMSNIGGTGKGTVDAAVQAAKTEVAEGKNVTVAKAEGTDGQAIYTVAVKDDITLKSVTTGTTKIDATGLSIGDKNYVSADGLNANDQVIKNVGAGSVAAGSKDAVNGNQLYEVDEKVTELGKKVTKVKNTAESLKAALGGNATIKDDGSVTVMNIGGTGKNTLDEAIKAVKTEVKAGVNVTVTPSTDKTDGHPVYTVAVNKDLAVDTVTTGATKVDTNGITIDNKQFVTKDGINANSTKITNVADGGISKTSKDAVNGSQLAAVKENIESVINEKIGNINGNTTNISNQIEGINKNMNALENRINSRMDKAVAGSAALAALHPLDFDENDKWNVAAGYGNYRSGSALALGAFYRPNEDTMFSIGGAMGNGQNMINVGVSLKLGQHNGVSKSRKAMTQEIDDLKAQLQAQDQKIAILMNAMANMQQGK